MTGTAERADRSTRLDADDACPLCRHTDERRHAHD
jgi:hypothetical protein